MTYLVVTDELAPRIGRSAHVTLEPLPGRVLPQTDVFRTVMLLKIGSN